MRSFVFPCEVIAEPDVGESLAAAGFADVLFEGIVLAGGVGLGGVFFAEHVAEVLEMGLRAGVLSLREGFPAVNKDGEGEGHGSHR